jgi:acyl-CoA reductase-like NAD-dependent aldehyde dehydrogenase
MGAKNHAVVMPDAHREAAVNALAGAAFGAAGEHSSKPTPASSIQLCHADVLGCAGR